ncbi:hypothetical protein [Streptomyces sp. G45]|uniref:hypothetical protein n=1 Tax=Streptomyces sp. G45 TaxID=3406627 RepID=UPI003C1D43E7
MGAYDDYRDEMFPDPKTEAARAKNRAEEERLARERQAEYDKLSPEEKAKRDSEAFKPIGLLKPDLSGLLGDEKK